MEDIEEDSVGRNRSARGVMVARDLHAACRDGELEEIRECLNVPGTDANKLQDGWRPIHHVALRNSPDIPECLALLVEEHGADVNGRTDPTGFTALHLLLKDGAPRESVEDGVLCLLKMGADTDLSDDSLRTAYDYAVVEGYENVVAALMEDEYNCIVLLERARRQYYGKQLIASVIASDGDRFAFCVRRGADVNAMNEYGAGAIHYLMTHCTLPVPRLLDILKRAGTDPNLRTYEGDTALNLAIKSKDLRERGEQQKVVTMLLQWGTEPTHQDLDGKDAVALAEEREYADVVVLLNSTKRQSSPDISPPPARSPVEEETPQERFFDVVLNGRLTELAPALDNPGVNLNNPNEDGEYVLHVALQRTGDTKETDNITKFLIERGANVNATDNNGSKPLHLTAEKDLHSQAQLLLDKGADKTIKNKAGLTAAEVAEKKGYTKTRDIILNHGKPAEKPKKDKKCVIS